jgi:hypothetical protein
MGKTGLEPVSFTICGVGTPAFPYTYTTFANAHSTGNLVDCIFDATMPHWQNEWPAHVASIKYLLPLAMGIRDSYDIAWRCYVSLSLNIEFS